jgi:hypothetical protein
VVFFGRGAWGGVKGHVSVPRKSLIRQLACRALVVLVDEYCTSKLCPLDFIELCSSDCEIFDQTFFLKKASKEGSLVKKNIELASNEIPPCSP